MPKLRKQARTHQHHKTHLSLKLMRLVFQFAGPIMPKLVSKFAYSLWFKTQRHPRPSRENLAFESAYHQFIDMDGRHIATYTWGEMGHGSCSYMAGVVEEHKWHRLSIHY